jgi:putative ABC transport system permease protein
MAALRRFVLRLVALFRPGRAETLLDREIATHLAMLEDEFRRRGLSAAEARAAARREFGGLDQTKEVQRDARSFVWLEDLRRDIRYTARILVRTPGFTIPAVLTLAIGIGGSTAVFSLIDAVLLRPLPFRDAHRMVMVFEDDSQAGFPQNVVAPANYGAWAASNDVFESVAAVTDFAAVLSGGSEPMRVEGRRATRSLFTVLDARPVMGRVFTPAEDRPGGPSVTILSYGLWQRRFGGDRTIVGRDVLLNNQRYVVVGVMPREFQFFEGYVGLWVPAAFTSEELKNGAHYVTMVGRMKPGVDVAAVKANLQTIGARLERQRPRNDSWFAARPVIVPFGEQIAGAARRPLVLLLTAVGVVLLITCANLASLLLARAASRHHEIALRGALGASRGRMVRQLLTESLTLSAVGLIVGIVLARWTFAFLEQLVPPAMTLFARPTLDGRTLALAALVAAVTGILFGLAPALQTTRLTLSDALRLGSRSVAGARARSILVVAEVAMTLVLLVAAGLLLQTFYQMRYADLGMRPEHVLTLRTALPICGGYEDPARRRAFYDRVLDRLERLPGVVAAGYTTSVPLEWKGGTSEVFLDGRTPEPGAARDPNHRQVSAGYLKAIGTPLRRGRYFDRRDDVDTQPVVIVNETMARQSWPGEDAVGKRFIIDRWQDDQRWLTVVGVVGDTRQMGLEAPARPEIYIPYQQIDSQPWFAPRDLVVRASGDPTDLIGAIKAAIHDVDPALPVSNVRTLDEVLDEDVATRRVGTTLLLAFAAFALLLATVGIYGVIAYFVAQHVPEMGVRIALGAETRDILLFVVGKGLKLALAGVIVGTVAALVATRLMTSLIYGVSGTGLITCLIAGAGLVLLALIASYIPARRATALDPIVALRAE